MAGEVLHHTVRSLCGEGGDAVVGVVAVVGTRCRRRMWVSRMAAVATAAGNGRDGHGDRDAHVDDAVRGRGAGDFDLRAGRRGARGGG